MNSRPWIVLKYGGTSVSTPERWARIADRMQGLSAGHRVCVVVSALAGVTDLLARAIDESRAGDPRESLAAVRLRHRELGLGAGLGAGDLEDVETIFDGVERRLEGVRILGEASPRIRAGVLAAGEAASSRLGAEILARHGVAVEWLDVVQVLESESRPGDSEEDRYLEARVPVLRDPGRMESRSGGSPAIITQGFVAGTPEGQRCLLGRGGSDTSAAHLAALLGAVGLEIWTDVPGMFTADPALVPGARVIRRLGYREAQELAGLGAKVLHPRAVEPVARFGIPLRILSTDVPAEPGTLVESPREEHPAVTAVTYRRGVTLITLSTVAMYGTAGYLARAFAAFEECGCSVDLVATSQTAVTVSLDRIPGGFEGAAFAGLRSRLATLGRVTVIHPCAVVSIVGRRIRAVLHEIGPAFEVLKGRPVHLVSDSSEDLNLSFVVDEGDGPLLVGRLHERLFPASGDDPNLGPRWDSLGPERARGRS